MNRISIEQTYSGRHVLITGASGFLGKVWLGMLLHQIRNIGRIYIVIRRNGSSTVQERFENIVNTSFVFKPLHEQLGIQLGEYISKRVEVIEGDVTLPNLGIEPKTAERLYQHVDLVVNCAGLVEFNPDIRDAMNVNVNGALHVAEFTSRCIDARLLHVSTCYVSGVKQGRIEETINSTVSPRGTNFDPEVEFTGLKATIKKLAGKQNSEKIDAEIRERMRKRDRKGHSESSDEKRENHLIRLMRRRYLREAMIEEGKRRASHWGWTDTYTYTKGLAEALLTTRFPDLSLSIFRPAIVESSVSFPFPGWNEGFNTSGPLAYLLGTWFRYLPAKKGNPFDVIPVDLVCSALTISGAAMLADNYVPVYQCGTSDRNLFTIDRACTLTSLAHRIYFRKNGSNAIEKMVLSRWDTLTTDVKHPLSISNLRKTTLGIGQLLKRIPGRENKLMVEKMVKITDKVERKLTQIDKVLELFLPYIHDNHRVFACQALNAIEIEEEEFRFSPEKIDWRDYWLNIHVPGLRRWCFPQIEGKDRPKYQPVEQFRFLRSEDSRPKSQTRLGSRPPLRQKELS